MNNVLADMLCEIYPDFFEVSENACFGQFGFEVGNGWFPLLASLLTQLRELAVHTGAKLSVEQIKETLGTLRVHFSCRYFADSDAVEWARLLVDTAEYLSATICGVCGGPANRLGGESWLLTCCLAHGNEEAWSNTEPQIVARLLSMPLPTIDLSRLPPRPRVEVFTGEGVGGVKASLVSYRFVDGCVGSSISTIESHWDIGLFESLSAAKTAIQDLHGQYPSRCKEAGLGFID